MSDALKYPALEQITGMAYAPIDQPAPVNRQVGKNVTKPKMYDAAEYQNRRIYLTSILDAPPFGTPIVIIKCTLGPSAPAGWEGDDPSSRRDVPIFPHIDGFGLSQAPRREE